MPADHAGLRLDQSVARLLPAHSRNRLQGWLRDGRILVDGERRDPKDKVWGGECLRVFAADEAAPAADRAEPIGLQRRDDIDPVQRMQVVEVHQVVVHIEVQRA